jgi:hypothetical protein
VADQGRSPLPKQIVRAMNAHSAGSVKPGMKTVWVKAGISLAALIGAGMGLVGCADGYYAHPGGYYASYTGSSYYPYYGAYGYPYRAYGPYYGYGYGYPYYGGSAVIVSGSRNYAYRNHYGRTYYRRNVDRVRNTSRTTRTRSATVQRQRQYQNDDERKYYQTR